MSDTLHRDPVVIGAGRAALDDLLSHSRAVSYAAVLSDDGFEIVHLESTHIDPSRFASMASSVQALSDAVADEVKIGASDYVVIGSELGYVIQLRVPGHSMVVAALFRNDETVGKALWATRTAAGRIAAALPRPLYPTSTTDHH